MNGKSLVQGLIVLILYFLGALVVGLALVPSLMFILHGVQFTAGWGLGPRACVLGFGLAAGFFVFGLLLMLLVGLLNRVLGLRLQQGHYTFSDGELLKWFFCNALVQAVKAFFMDFMLLTPFVNIFYRMMGAKLGLNVQINSRNVADISLLEIGSNTVIGGNATVIGHLFERKGIRLAKVRIGANVVVGLNAVLMPGVVIGDGAIIPAGAIVPMDTVVPPRKVFRAGDE